MLDHVSAIASVGEELIQLEELKARVAFKKDKLICYDGFEPSGRMHIAQGLMKCHIVNTLTQNGCVFKFWIADWFAMLNGKCNGNTNDIETLGLYFIEIWKASGMDLDNVEFIWASKEINKDPQKYWGLVMDIATKTSLTRVLRCCPIMGRAETDDLTAAQIMYPLMQCADIFYLEADICQLGLDQRKVNMLARQYCDAKKIRHKPIILSHHMLMGLKAGSAKMSKSDPDSAIFMDDSADVVNRKIQKAFAPEKIVKQNPLFDYLKHIIMPISGSILIEGHGTFTDYDMIVHEYENGAIHPSELKPAIRLVLNKMLQPIRDHFESDPNAKKLLADVQAIRVVKGPATPAKSIKSQIIDKGSPEAYKAAKHAFMAQYLDAM